MQLLSQEIELFELTDEIRKDGEKEHVKNPKRLTPINNYQNFFKDGHEDIITWEFFMARLNDIPNNIKISETRNRIKKATENAYYIFKLPKKYDPNKLDERFKNLDSSFYENCIIPIFFGTEKKLKKTNGKETFLSVIKRNYPYIITVFFIILVFCLNNSIHKMISLMFSVIFLMISFHNSILKNFEQFIKNIFGIFIANKKMNHAHCKIDDKYMNYGWRYPIKLIRLAILAVIGLSYSFFYCIDIVYDFNYNLAELYFGNSFTLGTLLILVWLAVILRWICKYIGKSHQLINGKHSIEYYCWQFFIFRIQYLNEKNILPMYYSRNFIRYYKSNFIIKEIEDGKYNDLGDIKTYIKSLENCRKFSNKEELIHKIIIQDMKNEKELKENN